MCIEQGEDELPPSLLKLEATEAWRSTLLFGDVEATEVSRSTVFAFADPLSCALSASSPPAFFVFRSHRSFFITLWPFVLRRERLLASCRTYNTNNMLHTQTHTFSLPAVHIIQIIIHIYT